jgi:hypothetical protein
LKRTGPVFGPSPIGAERCRRLRRTCGRPARADCATRRAATGLTSHRPWAPRARQFGTGAPEYRPSLVRVLSESPGTPCVRPSPGARTRTDPKHRTRTRLSGPQADQARRMRLRRDSDETRTRLRRDSDELPARPTPPAPLSLPCSSLGLARPPGRRGLGRLRVAARPGLIMVEPEPESSLREGREGPERDARQHGLNWIHMCIPYCLYISVFHYYEDDLNSS